MNKCLAILTLMLTFLVVPVTAQVFNYNSGGLDVDVTVVNECDGLTNGSITFTVNSASGPDATLSIILGPPDLLTAQVIPVGSSYTFDNGGAGLPGGTYDFIIADGTDNINTFTVTYPSVTVQSYGLITITTDTQTDNTSCSSPNGVIEVTLTGGSGSYNYTVSGPGGFSDAGTAVANDQLSYNSLEGGTYSFTVNDDNTVCFATQDIILADPTIAVNLDSTTPNTRCIAAFDGTVDITMTAGSGSYTFAWTGPGAFSSSSEDLTNLDAGTYDLTVTDDITGCFTTLSAIVGDATPTIGITVDAVTDNSNCTVPNGAIDITPTGGSGYTFAWTGPGAFSSTSEDLTGLLDGTYNLTVTDVASGCTATIPVIVADITPTVTINVDAFTPTTNCTVPDGSIDITVSGGTSYTYAWTGPGAFSSTSEDLTGLLPGTYDLTVTEVASTCTATTSVIIPDARPVVTITVDTVNPSTSCTVPDGSIDITVGGGTSYTYSWTGPGGFTSTSEDISGLLPGDYDIVVTEVASTCTQTVTGITVVDATPTISITVDNVTDNTSCTTPNGAIEITIAGGSGYTYAWTGPGGFTSTSEDITGLADGNYDVTVTDIASGCTATQTNINVADNTPTITVTEDTNTDNTNCVGPNGVLEITAGGGTSYSYAWTGPGAFSSTSEDLSGLAPGNYTVTVTDIPTGCTVVDTYTINDSSPVITATVDNVVDDSSCVTGNGSIDISVAGGTGYSYAWTGPGGFTDTAEDISGLENGTYDVTITDIASGCTTTLSQDILDITPTISITTDLVTPNSNCVGPNGAIDITPSGGTGYTYAWTGPGGFTDTNEDISNLAPGDYDITVTDVVTGCFATSTINVPDTSPTIDITLDTNTPNTSCTSPNGALDISVSGGTGYLFSWTGPGAFSDANEDISGLQPGSYTITATDIVTGCTDTEVFVVADASPVISVTIDSQVNNTNCVGPNGSIDITVSGGTGYTFSWTDGGTYSSTSEDISGLVGATYTVTVTDIVSGCTGTAFATITDVPVPVAVTADNIVPSDNCTTPNGSIDITASGGTGYTYSWSGPGSFSSTSEDISALDPGSYTITVTDVASGCTVTDTYVVGDATPTIVITVDSVTDNTDCVTPNGAIDVTVTGATNLVFSWTSLGGFTASTEDISGLIGDTYTLTVTDLDSDCSEVSAPIDVIELASPITVTGTVTDNTKCNPTFDGAIDITQTGATSPSYSWTGPNSFVSTSEDISNLEPGSYTVTVSELGCSTIENFIVADLSAPVGVTGSVTDNTSCTVFNGAITLTLTGSTGPTSYLWSGPGGFSATTKDITGLEAGTYDVIVTENNCDTFESFIVNDVLPTLGLSSVVVDNTNCTTPNGSIDITPSGATNYSFSWTSGGGFSSTNEDITGLIGDTYTVTVTDDDTGCTYMEAIVVNELASPITITETITDNSSCTAFNGAISLSVSGAGGSEVYSWTGPGGFTAATKDISGLEPGAYSVSVTESGCTTIGNYTVSDISPVPIITVDSSVDNTQCNAPFDGFISVTVTGGSGSYSYSWTEPGGYFSTSEDISNLEGGDYTLVVTDMATMCTASVVVSIGDPAPSICGIPCDGFSFSFNNTKPTCSLSNGVITFENLSYNGNPLVNYQITLQKLVGGVPVGAPIVVTNPPGGSIGGLDAADYQYEIEDFVSTETCNGTVPLPNAPTISASARDFVDAVCFGQSTGEATIDAIGSGTGDYLYSTDNGASWTNFTPGNPITGLPPNGTYDILVAEVAFDPCPVTVSITINNANPQIMADITTTDATCADGDGAITVNSVTGGSGNYNYLLDGNFFASLPTGGVFANITGGDHTLQVTDDLGCFEIYNITVNFPGAVEYSLSSTPPDCTDPMGSNGEVTVTINEAGNFDLEISETSGGTPLQTGSVASAGTAMFTFTGLAQDDYFVSVQNTSAPCPEIQMVTISGGPPRVDFEPSVVCSSGSVEVLLDNITGEGGSAITIEVYDLGGVTPITTINLPDIPVGNQFTITGEAFLSIPDDYEIILSQNQVFCAGGTITSELKGITIIDPISASVLSQTESYPDRPNGRLTIGNFLGGLPGYDIQINLITPIVTGQTYSTTFEPVGLNGSGDYEFLYTELPAGNYLVEVADQNGCTFDINVDIILNDDLFVPNIFTPNGDGINDVFFIRNKPDSPVELTISNRWGKQVYYSKDYNNNWNADNVRDGVYFYTMAFDGEVLRGWVEVQRGAGPGN